MLNLKDVIINAIIAFVLNVAVGAFNGSTFDPVRFVVAWFVTALVIAFIHAYFKGATFSNDQG